MLRTRAASVFLSHPFSKTQHAPRLRVAETSAKSLGWKFQKAVWVAKWVWVNKPTGDRRSWSMFPLAWVPLYPFFEPQPNGTLFLGRRSRALRSGWLALEMVCSTAARASHGDVGHVHCTLGFSSPPLRQWLGSYLIFHHCFPK